MHATRFRLDGPASAIRLWTRLTPRRHEHHQLVVRPLADERVLGTDDLGNQVWRVALHGPHTRVELTALTTLSLEAPPVPRGAALVADARRDVAGQPTAGEIHAYGAASLNPRRPLVEALLELAERLRADIAYRPDGPAGASPQEVLAQKSGACRDLSHLALACLRAHGVAGRYVAGYFIPRGATAAPAMHAWVSVPCPDGGTVDFDPTLGGLCDQRHVPVALGATYDDVPPIRGALGEERRQASEVHIRFEHLPDVPRAT